MKRTMPRNASSPTTATTVHNHRRMRAAFRDAHASHLTVPQKTTRPGTMRATSIQYKAAARAVGGPHLTVLPKPMVTNNQRVTMTT